jgi:hypothetical protein
LHVKGASFESLSKHQIVWYLSWFSSNSHRNRSGQHVTLGQTHFLPKPFQCIFITIKQSQTRLWYHQRDRTNCVLQKNVALSQVLDKSEGKIFQDHLKACRHYIMLTLRSISNLNYN